MQSSFDCDSPCYRHGRPFLVPSFVTHTGSREQTLPRNIEKVEGRTETRTLRVSKGPAVAWHL